MNTLEAFRCVDDKELDSMIQETNVCGHEAGYRVLLAIKNERDNIRDRLGSVQGIDYSEFIIEV